MDFIWKDIFKRAFWAGVFALLAALCFVTFLGVKVIFISIIAAALAAVKEIICWQIWQVWIKQDAVFKMDDEGDA